MLQGRGGERDLKDAGWRVCDRAEGRGRWIEEGGLLSIADFKWTEFGSVYWARVELGNERKLSRGCCVSGRNSNTSRTCLVQEASKDEHYAEHFRILS